MDFNFTPLILTLTLSFMVYVFRLPDLPFLAGGVGFDWKERHATFARGRLGGTTDTLRTTHSSMIATATPARGKVLSSLQHLRELPLK